MDDCDLGSRHEDYFRRRAIDEARGKKDFGASRSQCIDCEEPIPAARRKAVPGCRRCVDCQAQFELRGGYGI